MDFREFCCSAKKEDGSKIPLNEHLAVMIKGKSEWPATEGLPAWVEISREFLGNRFLEDDYTRNGKFDWQAWITRMNFHDYSVQAFLYALAKHRPTGFRTLPSRYQAFVPESAITKIAVVAPRSMAAVASVAALAGGGGGMPLIPGLVPVTELERLDTWGLPEKEDDEDRACVVCFQHKPNALIVDCGHTFCSLCVKQLRPPTLLCPSCKVPITYVRKLFN